MHTISLRSAQNFVYASRRAFHPKRLHEFVSKNFVFFDDAPELEPEEGEEEKKEEEVVVEDVTNNDNNDNMEVEDNSKNEKLEAERNNAAESCKKFGRILRSKGFMWIATRPGGIGEWSQAGAVARLGYYNPWFASVPEDRWPGTEGSDTRRQIRADFLPEERDMDVEDLDPVLNVGDRRQEVSGEWRVDIISRY